MAETSPYQKVSDELLDAGIDCAVAHLGSVYITLQKAKDELTALNAERERRDAERGITRSGAPCRTCGACHRCYLGDHGMCHGCRCGCQDDDARPTCDHGPGQRGHPASHEPTSGVDPTGPLYCERDLLPWPCPEAQS